MARKYPQAPAPLLTTMDDDLALDHLRDGGVLVHMHGKANERQWYVIPGGPVTDTTAEKIKQRPDIIGQKDGLWPGFDQTWRMQRAGAL
jgi:hypothetical protein